MRPITTADPPAASRMIPTTGAAAPAAIAKHDHEGCGKGDDQRTEAHRRRR
jgi:hypothetical protein